MSRRTMIVAAAAISVLAVVAWLVFSPTEEQRIKAQLVRLATAVRLTADDTNAITRGARIRSELEAVLDPNVRLSIPEVTSLRSGRQELATTATAASAYLRTFEVTLDELEIKLDEPKTSAKVAA